MKIAIVGAGISGLAAARFLQELGHEPKVFEAAPGPRAGLLESRKEKGYTFDVGGGHIIYSRDPWASSFFDELYSDEPLLRHSRCSKVLFDDRLVKYPFENGLSELPREVNYECILGYVQAWVQRRGAKKPANFREWIEYKLGPGIARHFMVPYNEKVWKTDLRDMSLDWISGRIPEAPLEDILQSSLGISSEGYQHQIRFQYPARGGIQDLAKRVGAPVSNRIVYDHAVKHIRKKGGHGFIVDDEEFDHVVYTAPLDQAPGIVEGLDERSGRAAQSLQHISLTTLLFGIPEGDARPLSWVYLPMQDQGPVNRVSYVSNYSPDNAPEGCASLLAEITHRGPLDVDDGLVADVRHHLCKLGFLHKDRILFEANGQSSYAYILFDRDFKEKQREAQAGMHKLGIRLLGRFGQYDYLNMDHCLICAKELAGKIHSKE